uniref:Uncharacterized protein MANES_14G021400 n=1 Tax=Rhizophora mucronata TaxID=61149 RepID=A0A2P2LJZ5_RHIMU
MIETATAVRFAAGANLCSSTLLPHYRPCWHLEEACSVHMFSGRLPRSAGFDVPRNKFRKLTGGYFLRRSGILKNGIQACAGKLGSASEPLNPKSRERYHPFEDITGSTEETGGDARLTAAETARTIVEVNSKATLMLTGLIEDEIHENVIWPGLPYVTDKHGNIYFQVKSDEEILQTLTPEDNFVQVIVGFDAMEMMAEMELLGPSENDFGIEEFEDEDSNLEDSDDEDEDDEDESYDEVWLLFFVQIDMIRFSCFRHECPTT